MSEENMSHEATQEILFHTLQQKCGKAIIRTLVNKEGYLKALFEPILGDKAADETASFVDVVSDAVATIKTVECLVYSILKGMADGDMTTPPGGLRFLIDSADFLTKSLLLTNGITNKETLLSIYKEEDVSRSISLHETAVKEGAINQTGIEDAAKELQELVRKHRETKKDGLT